MTEHNITTIDVHDLKNRLDANPDLLIIDVRENNEWQEGHLASAIHIPKDEISAKIKSITNDNQHPIYLYCRGGVRSLYAAHCLMEMGYQTVYSVNGGISDWIYHGYPIIV